MSREYDDYDDYGDRGNRHRRHENIPNYLGQAIAVTACCCVPLGIVAIINAAQVNSKLSSGDIRGAREASEKAKQWCWAGFILGLIANIIVVAFQIFAQSQMQPNRF